MKETLGFTPDEESVIENTLGFYSEQIIENPGSGINIVSQLIALMSREFGKNPLKIMQQIFDRHEFPVKFIAIPIESPIEKIGKLMTDLGELPSDAMDYNVRMPHSGNTDYPYRLWITVGRDEEYQKLLKKLDITPEQNLNRLDQTGVLVLKDDDTSGALNARKN